MKKLVAYTMAGLPGLSVAAQTALIQAFARSSAERFQLLYAHDDSSAAGLPFNRRAGGRGALLAADQGDLLVLATLRAAGMNLAKVLAAFEGGLRRGVHLVALQEALDTRAHEPVLRGLAGFQQRVASERRRQCVAAARERGRCVNQHVPPGWRIVGRKNSRRRVRDQKEAAAIDRMVRWHEQGLSLDEIHLRLLVERVRRRDGREWARSTIHSVISKQAL